MQLREGFSDPFNYLKRKYLYKIIPGGEIAGATDGISLLTIQEAGRSLLDFVVRSNSGRPPVGSDSPCA